MIASDSSQARFLVLLPKIESCARSYFRDVKCPDKKADRIAEVIALAWKRFLMLEQQGKDAAQFVTVFATLTSRAIGSGRRLAGMERAKDLLSCRTRQRYGVTVTSLSDQSTPFASEFQEALRDNTQTPPPDAAAFRIDFPRWLTTLNKRKRRLACDLMAGEKTLVAARSCGVSPSRISQLRRELHQNWNRFHGETVCESL